MIAIFLRTRDALAFAFFIFTLAACTETLTTLPIVTADAATSDAPVALVSLSAIALTTESLTLKAVQKGRLSLTATLSNGSIFRKVGTTLTTPYYGLTEDVQWFSNNTDVVTVDGDGTLTGIAAGSTTVKASLQNMAVLAEITVTEEQASSLDETAFPDEDSGEGVAEETSVSDEPTDTVTAPVPEEAFDPNDYFLGDNDTLTIAIGEDGGFGESNFPDVVYGAPISSRTDVLSLGHGGEIVIELGGYIVVDGPDEDFTVFENAFTGWVEPAIVAVSTDGVVYQSFPCDPFDPEEIYDGCAGIIPVNYADDEDYLDPLLSGGDSFDLAVLGLTEVRFIKITDAEACTSAVCVAPSAGFDLDAVAIINGVNE